MTAEPKDSPPRRRTRKQQARRQEVVDTAARLFFERGYAETSTQEIGAALGMLKGSIYYYISSKEDLLFEIVQTYHDATRSHFERIAASDATPLEKIRALIEADTENTANNLTRSSLFFTEWRVLPPERQKVILDQRAEHEQAMVNWIRDAQADGDMRGDLDAQVATFAIFGMVNSVYRWFRPDGRKSSREIARDFSDLLLAGLLTR